MESTTQHSPPMISTLMSRLSTDKLTMLLDMIRKTNLSTNIFNLTGIPYDYNFTITDQPSLLGAPGGSASSVGTAGGSGGGLMYEYIDTVALKVFFYGLYILIFFLGIAGNALVCYVVLRNSSMHTVTNWFITNLALSDIFLCVFAVPFTPLYLLTYKEWVFGTVLCHLVPYAQGVSVYISAFTLMSIAIDRYFVIIYPFKARMEMRVCLSIIVAIWLSACLLTLPYGIFMELEHFATDVGVVGGGGGGGGDGGGYTMMNNIDDDDHLPPGLVPYCEERWPYDESRKAFGISTSVLQFIIPFVIITFCYVRVCGKLWDRARARPGSVSMRREEIERERTRKTNGMLISMVVIFVISWLPLNSYNLVHDFYIPASYWRYSRAFFVLAHAVAMSSTCYNPFLYAWLNENFRKEFKQVLPCFRANCSTVAAMEMRHRVIKQQQQQHCMNGGSGGGNGHQSIGMTINTNNTILLSDKPQNDNNILSATAMLSTTTTTALSSTAVSTPMTNNNNNNNNNELNNDDDDDNCATTEPLLGCLTSSTATMKANNTGASDNHKDRSQSIGNTNDIRLTVIDNNRI